jgi:hypothetical protein
MEPANNSDTQGMPNLPKKHLRLIRFAFEKCMEVPRKKKHCSLILHGNRIVAWGTNRFKTHPMAVEHGYLFDEVHSELDAFIRCDLRDDLVLWNFRFNRKGEMRMARPCPKCLPWCMKVFDRIHYTTPEGIREVEISRMQPFR